MAVPLHTHRSVYIHDPGQNKALNSVSSNLIHTTKYSVWSFLPKFLFEQFSRYANIFFLLTACIQQIPQVSPVSRWTTILPLLIVLSASGIKEVWEDLKRHRSDQEVNRRRVQVFVPFHHPWGVYPPPPPRGFPGTWTGISGNGEFIWREWRDLRIGDILRVNDGEDFPADMVLLASSEPDSICYIETSNLDGETNLKVKQGLADTAMAISPQQLSQMKGMIKSETPNDNLYTFQGTLCLPEKELPLGPTELLLRGSRLCHTPWIYGIVIYTGHDTKLLRNAHRTPLKRTRMERETNFHIVFLFVMLVFLSLICAIFGQIWMNWGTGNHAHVSWWYLDLSPTSVWNRIGQFFKDVLTFLILFNNLIPISLMVTVEVVKFQQALFINSDREMYDAEYSQSATARTSNLMEELGQVQYVFSDKTGTLTQNQMEFRVCSVAGICFIGNPKMNTEEENEEGRDSRGYSNKNVSTAEAWQYSPFAARPPVTNGWARQTLPRMIPLEQGLQSQLGDNVEEIDNVPSIAYLVPDTHPFFQTELIEKTSNVHSSMEMEDAHGAPLSAHDVEELLRPLREGTGRHELNRTGGDPRTENPENWTSKGDASSTMGSPLPPYHTDFSLLPSSSHAYPYSVLMHVLRTPSHPYFPVAHEFFLALALCHTVIPDHSQVLGSHGATVPEQSLRDSYRNSWPEEGMMKSVDPSYMNSEELRSIFDQPVYSESGQTETGSSPHPNPFMVHGQDTFPRSSTTSPPSTSSWYARKPSHVSLPFSLGTLKYQASSPDENALVNAARSFHYTFHTRRPCTLTIRVQGEDVMMELLNVLEFNSQRKRMSVIVRDEKGQITLYCKGADNVILERLKRTNDDDRNPREKEEKRGGKNVHPGFGKRETAMKSHKEEENSMVDVTSNPWLDDFSHPSSDSSFVGPLHETSPHRLAIMMEQLELFAIKGLRTLCVAMRRLTWEEYEHWNWQFQRASTVLVNRQQEVDAVAENIEKDLIMLGTTAIEDKLQRGVPDTIHHLLEAGISVWVLTGDKQETAINIGYSCKLLNEDMTVLVCSTTTHFETKEYFESQKRDLVRGQMDSWIGHSDSEVPPTTSSPYGRSGRGDPFSTAFGDASATRPFGHSNKEEFALVMEGKALEYALEEDIQRLFLEVAHRCKAVICCRVSPLQKALIVRLVKTHMNAVTLAIGDGANDVGMIQAAHVGIGISGREGLQAARSADFSISQFRHLERLLFVHGAWSYRRLSKLVLYSFYKNAVLSIMEFWYAFYNAFSGQTIFEQWSITLWNVLFTLMPPLTLGIFDQYVSARMQLRHPALYQLGQEQEFFDRRSFWGWMLNAFVHSLLLFLLGKACINDTTPLPNGQGTGFWLVGTFIFTATLSTVIFKAALITDTWTIYSHIGMWGSLFIWFVFLFIYSLPFPARIAKGMAGVASMLYSDPAFWFSLILLCIVTMSRDYLWKVFKRQISPRPYHIVQEIDKYHLPDTLERMERFTKAIRKVRMWQRMKRTRGYAFSQNEEGQAELIRRYDTTRMKPSGY